MPYTFAAYDVLQINSDNGKGWQDFATLRTKEDAAIAEASVRSGRWQGTIAQFRIVGFRDGIAGRQTVYVGETQGEMVCKSCGYRTTPERAAGFMEQDGCPECEARKFEEATTVARSNRAVFAASYEAAKKLIKLEGSATTQWMRYAVVNGRDVTIWYRTSVGYWEAYETESGNVLASNDSLIAVVFDLAALVE